MKRLIVLILLSALASQLSGRLTKDWTFQEMFAKSDVVVIAMPIETSETTEHTTLAELSPPLAVLGLNTEFRALLVLKGDKEMTKFVLHHYKLEHEEPMINAPQLIAFDSKASPKRFLLFLARERDGKYAPVTGQADPALYSVIPLQTDAN